MKTKENIIFCLLISAFVLYIVWHLGRWYGVTETRKTIQTGTITEDAYNYYLLTKCLSGEINITRK